jgi:hypothetical protein
MSRFQAQLARGEEDLRQLRTHFSDVRQELIDTRRRLRQYQVRKTYIANDIRRERQHFEEMLSSSGTNRIAA